MPMHWSHVSVCFCTVVSFEAAAEELKYMQVSTGEAAGEGQSDMCLVFFAAACGSIEKQPDMEIAPGLTCQLALIAAPGFENCRVFLKVPQGGNAEQPYLDCTGTQRMRMCLHPAQGTAR